MIYQINKAANGARADDTSALKIDILGLIPLDTVRGRIEPSLPLAKSELKLGRGRFHPQILDLLLPPHILVSNDPR